MSPAKWEYIHQLAWKLHYDFSTKRGDGAGRRKACQSRFPCARFPLSFFCFSCCRIGRNVAKFFQFLTVKFPPPCKFFSFKVSAHWLSLAIPNCSRSIRVKWRSGCQSILPAILKYTAYSQNGGSPLVLFSSIHVKYFSLCWTFLLFVELITTHRTWQIGE